MRIIDYGALIASWVHAPTGGKRPWRTTGLRDAPRDCVAVPRLNHCERSRQRRPFLLVGR